MLAVEYDVFWRPEMECHHHLNLAEVEFGGLVSVENHPRREEEAVVWTNVTNVQH